LRPHEVASRHRVSEARITKLQADAVHGGAKPR
jgi:hypothetical protein